MGFWAAIESCFSKYATFSGRAPRSEYWYFVLAHFIVVAIVGFIGRLLAILFDADPKHPSGISVAWSIVGLIIVLAFYLPNLSVTVRRLHDRDRSGWWYWLNLVPLVGAIWLFVWYCLRGTGGDNRFGPDPFGPDMVGSTPTDATAAN